MEIRFEKHRYGYRVLIGKVVVGEVRKNQNTPNLPFLGRIDKKKWIWEKWVWDKDMGVGIALLDFDTLEEAKAQARKDLGDV